MSTVVAIALLVVAVVLIVGGAELRVDGLLRAAARLRLAPFAVVGVIAGLDVENLAAGIAANAKGLPGAAVVASQRCCK